MRRVSPPAVSTITTSEAMVGVKQIERTDRQRALFWLPVCVCVNPAERETPFQPASIFYLLFPFLNFTSLPFLLFYLYFSLLFSFLFLLLFFSFFIPLFPYKLLIHSFHRRPRFNYNGHNLRSPHSGINTHSFLQR